MPSMSSAQNFLKNVPGLISVALAIAGLIAAFVSGSGDSGKTETTSKAISVVEYGKYKASSMEEDVTVMFGDKSLDNSFVAYPVQLTDMEITDLDSTEYTKFAATFGFDETKGIETPAEVVKVTVSVDGTEKETVEVKKGETKGYSLKFEKGKVKTLSLEIAGFDADGNAADTEPFAVGEPELS